MQAYHTLVEDIARSLEAGDGQVDRLSSEARAVIGLGNQDPGDPERYGLGIACDVCLMHKNG